MASPEFRSRSEFHALPTPPGLQVSIDDVGSSLFGRHSWHDRGRSAAPTCWRLPITSKISRVVAALLFIATVGCVVATGMALGQRIVAPYYVVPEAGPGGTVIVGCGSAVSPQEPHVSGVDGRYAGGHFVGGSCEERRKHHWEFAAGSTTVALLFAGAWFAWRRRVRRSGPGVGDVAATKRLPAVGPT